MNREVENKSAEEARIAGLGSESEDLKFVEAMLAFKSSVHEWSDTAYSRPRPVVSVARRSWRVALGWAMGCVLLVGSASAGLVQHRHSQDLARQVAAQRAADQAAAERAQQLRARQAAEVPDDDLLAGVNSDVSRQVPSALEGMAQMMQDYDKK